MPCGPPHARCPRSLVCGVVRSGRVGRGAGMPEKTRAVLFLDFLFVVGRSSPWPVTLRVPWGWGCVGKASATTLESYRTGAAGLFSMRPPCWAHGRHFGPCSSQAGEETCSTGQSRAASAREGKGCEPRSSQPCQVWCGPRAVTQLGCAPNPRVQTYKL